MLWIGSNWFSQIIFYKSVFSESVFSETVIVCSVFTENFIYGQCIFWSNLWIGETHSLLATPPHVKFASLKTVLNEGGAFITVSLTAKKFTLYKSSAKKTLQYSSTTNETPGKCSGGYNIHTYVWVHISIFGHICWANFEKMPFLWFFGWFSLSPTLFFTL